MARRSKKSSHSRPKSKAPSSKERAARAAFSPVSQAGSADYESRQRKIRIAGPAPKTQIGKLQREIDLARENGVPKMRSKNFEQLEIPSSVKTAQQFINLAEKDPQGFNALKGSNETFGFTIFDHQSRALFKNVQDMIDMLRFYLQRGSAHKADFSVFRVNETGTWRKDKHVTKVSSSKGLKATKQRYAKRRRKHVKEAKYRGEPYGR